MVDRRVSDGRRIAELLASELTGLAVGPLAEVAVTDADPDLTPSDEGSLAYRIAFSGTRVARVEVFPGHARVSLTVESSVNTNRYPWQSLAGVESDRGTVEFRVESGRAVKPAVDALEQALEDE